MRGGWVYRLNTYSYFVASFLPFPCLAVLIPAPSRHREGPMTITTCVRYAVAMVVLGSLGCATAPRDPASLQVQRASELDRLGQQVGMGYARVAPSALEARNNANLPPGDD